MPAPISLSQTTNDAQPAGFLSAVVPALLSKITTINKPLDIGKNYYLFCVASMLFHHVPTPTFSRV
jgi:hypothetical protein